MEKADILICCFLKFFFTLIGITLIIKRDQNPNKQMMNKLAPAYFFSVIRTEKGTHMLLIKFYSIF